MDRIRFKTQTKKPLVTDEVEANDVIPIFTLCNTEPKQLIEPKERALISMLQAFTNFELIVDTRSWTYIVKECTIVPEKLRYYKMEHWKYEFPNEKAYIWSTFEVLNYLQKLYEEKYAYNTYIGRSINKEFKELKFVSYKEGMLLCTPDYKSLSLSVAFDLIRT